VLANPACRLFVFFFLEMPADSQCGFLPKYPHIFPESRSERFFHAAVMPETPSLLNKSLGHSKIHGPFSASASWFSPHHGKPLVPLVRLVRGLAADHSSQYFGNEDLLRWNLDSVMLKPVDLERSGSRE
jgi:hypothetical protein